MSELLSSIIPIPFVTSSGVFNGWEQSAASCCRNCLHFSCLTMNVATGSHSSCAEGMSFVAMQVTGKRLCLGGFLHSTKNNVVGGDRRKGLLRLLLDEGRLEKIIENVKKYEALYEREMKEAASETTSFLHDIRTGLSLVMSSCEKLISSGRGFGFSDKLKKADPALFRLYQSISLLTQQLGLVDIISNPDSISYGLRTKSDIYQFFHKMVKLFEPRGWDRRIDFQMEGSVYVAVEFYNSFQLVPLVLLDNAVKYATPGTTVYVRFLEKMDGLYAEFCSWGPIVPPEYSEAIFEKRVRGPNVLDRSSEGSGLGLFIASLVTKVHGFSLSYEARDCDSGAGWNCFILFIDEKFLRAL